MKFSTLDFVVPAFVAVSMVGFCALTKAIQLLKPVDGGVTVSGNHIRQVESNQVIGIKLPAIMMPECGTPFPNRIPCPCGKTNHWLVVTK